MFISCEKGRDTFTWGGWGGGGGGLWGGGGGGPNSWKKKAASRKRKIPSKTGTLEGEWSSCDSHQEKQERERRTGEKLSPGGTFSLEKKIISGDKRSMSRDSREEWL